ncbi:class I SAM-dependent methyltransferase [Xanthobacter variabilis]|uniref:class I SAM-dependent methyltransferase n=1 Tax=Xanthobacter variabilis TaxID=3119932 RepID=UPI0037279955
MKALYEQTGLPVLQNRVYATAREAQACQLGDVRLVQDPATGLVFNAAFRPELVIYDSNYHNEQSLSSAFVRHLEEVREIIARRLGRERLVEVGCGKGFFLEMLLAAGFDIVGFDAAYEGDNPRIQRRFFEPGMGMSSDGLILRHVLEHIADPVAFLQNLKVANGGQGLIYIEVPCLDWILENRAWFDIFYEHVNYFRLADLNRMFGTVVESGRLFGGQYLYVVADLATVQAPAFVPGDAVTVPENFAASLATMDGAGGAIWGCASKGVIYALLRARAGHPVDLAIDINPAKQGRHMPVTGLRVHAPDEGLALLAPGSTIYIMNPNYADEIRAMSHHAYRYVEVGND